MIKKSIIKKISIIFGIIIIILIINIFPVKKITTTLNNSNLGSIYLLDNNNYVSKLDYYYTSNNTLNMIKEIIDILTIDSNYEIRDGFSKIIPKNTKLLNYSLLDKTLTLNFSKELLNVTLENEEKLIESIVYSLTSLNNIDNIIIKVENIKLTRLPNSKKELPEILNKSIHINKEYDLDSINNIFSTTIVYHANYNNFDYYIPVTKYTNEDNKIEIIISELKSHTTFNTNIIDYIEDLELTNYEILDNNIILNLTSLNDNILESVKYAINESINENYNKQVIYYLNNNIIT